MATSQRKILVTSALPYANGPIHLAHMLEYIQTDIWSRYQKLRGHECHYICADDAHGTPIMLKAQQLGMAPEEMIAQVNKEHQQDFADFNIAFDNYHSTHSDENRVLASDIYLKLRANGYIKSKSISQLFDPEKSMFLQTASSKAPALSVNRPINTATTVMPAAQLTAQLSLSIQNQRYRVPRQ